MTTFYVALAFAIGAALADLIHRYILPTYLDGRQDMRDEIDQARRMAGFKGARTRKARQDAQTDEGKLTTFDAYGRDAGEGRES